MPELVIESNGLIEKTAVYYNGDQLSGIKELFLNMDENGTFDAFIQYEGADKVLYTRNIFSDSLPNVKTSEPTFTEEEAMELQQLSIVSDGEIENTELFWNEEELDGVVSLFVQIAASKQQSKGLSSVFSKKQQADVTCKAEITFRNEDESIETEVVF